jgi:hypothetical protein
MGSGHTDGRRAADSQFDDGPTQGRNVTAPAPDQPVRQDSLVDQDNFTFVPGHDRKREWQ